MEEDFVAPVVLFAFKRPDHLRLTLKALAAHSMAARTHVTAFVDFPRDPKDLPLVDAVCEVLAHWQRLGAFASVEVIRAASPKGLARSVIEGVGAVLESYDRVIVLEDDIVLAPTGLCFLNDALEKYADDARVWSVSAYSPDQVVSQRDGVSTYFSRRASSWGYGTWKRSWVHIEWDDASFEALANDRHFRRAFARGGHDLPPMLDKQLRGEIDSWAVRWCARQAEAGKLTLYPSVSLAENTGMDGSGTHSPLVKKSSPPLGTWTGEMSWPREVRVQRRIERRFQRVFVSRFRVAGARLRSRLRDGPER